MAALRCSHGRTAGWFLSGGSVGLLVALGVMIVQPIDPLTILFLWPPSIMGLAEPKGFWDKVVLVVIEFGGNFFLYGAAGALISVVIERVWP
jgi:hypothetical protein